MQKADIGLLFGLEAVVELGGSDAYLILADADLDVAAEAVVTARIMNTG